MMMPMPMPSSPTVTGVSVSLRGHLGTTEETGVVKDGVKKEAPVDFEKVVAELQGSNSSAAPASASAEFPVSPQSSVKYPSPPWSSVKYPPPPALAKYPPPPPLPGLKP